MEVEEDVDMTRRTLLVGFEITDQLENFLKRVRPHGKVSATRATSHSVDLLNDLK